MATPTDPTAGERHEDEPHVVVRDKRRLDPVTGAVREGAEATGGIDPVAPPVTRTEPSVLEQELTERTEDLLRLKAEYDNYRKRAQRDIAAAAEIGTARVLVELLPALDDVDRARAHGELDPAFRAVSEHLEKVCTAVGLERYGAKGEPFDPNRHEALTSVEDPSAEHETVQDVYRAGYAYAGRILRPAQVVVATPAHGSADASTATFGDAAGETADDPAV
ncbi:MAG TPA: nucleotide exchange factor GrpE [Mycobacteriales bacterium]|nr:nucleotide exchange factor GrpE [Mycobacteriales bacterium]